MNIIAWILLIVGLCIELAGLLGFGPLYTYGGIALAIIGGILWGLSPGNARN